MNKNANLAVSIAAGLLISGVAFEAMADGSSQSGSVRVACPQSHPNANIVV